MLPEKDPKEGTDKEEASPLKKFLQENDVLLILYPQNKDGFFYSFIVGEDEIKIYELLKEKKEIKKKLLIYLNTGGGNVYSAVKIIDILREKYSSLDIAIARKAKSAGTLMCMGADNVIMSTVSEMGPLDKPIMHPEKETITISALDVVRSLDGIIEMAIKKQKQLAKDITAVSTEKSIELAGDFISKLMSPMICKEDSKAYNEARRLLNIASIYGKELFSKNMLKWLKDRKLRDKLAEIVVNSLVWEYPDHTFAIRRNEAKKQFFNVKNSETLGYIDELWPYFKETIGKEKKKIIKFL